MCEVKDIYRKIKDLNSLGELGVYEDPSGYINLDPNKVKTMQTNPFARSADECAQLMGLYENTIIGGICPIPLQVVADGIVYSAICGSRLLVLPEYRKTNYGMLILDKMRDLCKDGIALSCGMSDMSRRLVRFLGQKVFLVPRHILIRRSREFTSYRRPKFLWKILSCCLDIVFALQRWIVAWFVAVKFRGLTIREILPSDEEALVQCARLVASDMHRLRENINVAWLKWVLENDFRSLEKANKHCYGVYRGEDLIAFWISRTDGLCARGRLMEWQVRSDFAKLKPWILLKGALMIAPKCNIVMLDTDDAPCNRVFKRFGLLAIPGQVCAIGAAKESPLRKHEGFEDQSNWRLRMSIADAKFF